MTKSRLTLLAATVLCAAMLCSIVVPDGTGHGVSAAPFAASRERAPRRPLRVGHPTFASPHASPIAVHDGVVFVVNTAGDPMGAVRRTMSVGHRVILARGTSRKSDKFLRRKVQLSRHTLDKGYFPLNTTRRQLGQFSLDSRF